MTAAGSGATEPLAAADAYARHVGRYTDELAGAFLAFAGVRPGMRVLDVGCGPGALASRAAALVGEERVAGVDPSAPYVEACRRRVRGADIRVAGAEDLPFADRCFDAVLAQLVMQVLRDPPGAVAELRRVTVPRGVVATCVWDFRDGMPLVQAYWDAARSVDPGGVSRAGSDGENRWCTPDGLLELWSGAGLQQVELGELQARARYRDAEDAWWSFAAGVGTTGAHCRSLPADGQARIRDEFRRRLGSPAGPFELTARAWAIRGRAG